MAIQFQYPDVDPYLVRAIDHKVRHLYGKYELTCDDLDDLRQELFVHALQYAHTFDPRRAQWTTFIDRLIKSGIANFLRAREAGMRRFETCELVGDVEDGEQSIPYVTTVDGTPTEMPLTSEGWMRDVSTDAIDLRLDVEAVLATLSPLHQRICRLFMTGATVTAVARTLGMPRTSLYFYLDQIQRIFVAHGFEVFFRVTRHF